MEKKENTPENIISRRNFFKKISSAALPIIAATSVSSVIHSCEIDDENYYCPGCEGSCQKGCKGSCTDACKGNCKGECHGSCKTHCYGKNRIV